MLYWVGWPTKSENHQLNQPFHVKFFVSVIRVTPTKQLKGLKKQQLIATKRQMLDGLTAGDMFGLFPATPKLNVKMG